MGHQILRFERTDDTSAFILVQVSPNGTRGLDVKLVGTEGEYPYMVALRQNQIPSLKAKNAPSTDAEWQSTLEALVRGEPRGDLQATATLEAGKSVVLTLRKRTGDVTQRLGSITLSHSPNEEIELVEWCGDAVLASLEAREELVAANSKVAGLQLAVAELQTQIDELIEAKEATETAWLEKFRDLLNEKKLRIREQLKILNSLPPPAEPGKGRRSAAAPKTKAAPKKPARGAAPSRPGKRKTRAEAQTKEEDTSDDEPEPIPPGTAEADEMDVDEREGKEQLSDDRETTDADPTASEADSDSDSDVADAASIRRKTRASAAKPPSPVRDAPTRTTRGSSSKAQGDKPAAQAPEKVPPKRDLPFIALSKALPKAQPHGEDSETDDEL